jgi:hypothetical protein
MPPLTNANPSSLAGLAATQSSKGAPGKVASDFGKTPLVFEENVGQTDARVDFIARTGGYTAFITPTGPVFSIVSADRPTRDVQGPTTPESAEAVGGAAIHMQVLGGNPGAQPTAVNRQPGIVNYFIGNDPSHWHANVSTFGGVQYKDAYPGINLVYYGNGQQLEYDFVVSPGADPNQIGLSFAGANNVEINPEGDLLLRTAAGELVQHKPFTYQEVGGTRREVPSSYVVEGTEVRFEISAYDKTTPLVIDPLVMEYSTYLGSSDTNYFEWCEDIAVDSAGNAYVTGRTPSNRFPTTPGTFDSSFNGDYEAFVTKLNTSGSALVYSTYLGGSEADYGYGIAVDGDGNAFVTGSLESNNFPTTPTAFDKTFNGGSDMFVTKLNSTGSSLDYSTYLGSSNYDWGFSIAVHEGLAHVAGINRTGGFPIMSGAFDSTNNGGLFEGVVTKLSRDGSALVYSTYLGGAGGSLAADVAIGTDGSAYVTGGAAAGFPTTPGAYDTTLGGETDAFIAKLTPDGSGLVYSTFVGGSDYENQLNGYDLTGIALDSNGSAYITGKTNSTDFPTTSGAFDSTHNGSFVDAFVAKVSADGSSLVYGTYLGGSGQEYGSSIAVDGDRNAYVVGSTSSDDFPTSLDAFDSSLGAGIDAFVSKISADGTTLTYGTFLGGGDDEDGGNGIAVDDGGNVYVTGATDSNAFPTTPGAFRRRSRSIYDGFVTKFAEV